MKNRQKKELPNITEVFETLKAQYGEAKTELTYENEFQLLIAVILSAQCTDARVNLTTPALFSQFPTPGALANAKPKEVEKLIHSCGFYRQKAISIQSAAKDIAEKFQGKIPKTMEELTGLRGVGRKTASVVMNQAFGLPAIAVDTHVKRVSQRLGWTESENPEKIESDLKEVIPMPLWCHVNGLLIFHGRRICKARKPLCNDCEIKSHCAYFHKHEEKVMGRKQKLK